MIERMSYGLRRERRKNDWWNGVIRGSVGGWCVGLSGLAVATVSADRFFEREAVPFLQKHCYECHAASKVEGDFRVDTLTADFTDHRVAAAWVEVRDMLNLDEMPPVDEPRPEVAEAEALSRWVAGQLREAERASLANNGRILMRRLNRTEYTHTLSDLLMLEFPTGRSPLDFLPPDGTAEGFDKVSAALLIDPSLMKQYYEVARMVLDQAVVDGDPEYPTQTNRMEFEAIAESKAIRYLTTRLEMEPVGDELRVVNGTTRSFAMLKYQHDGKGVHVTPTNGIYRFTVAARGEPGEDGKLPRLRLTQGHPDEEKRLLMEFVAEPGSPKQYSVTIPRDDLGGEIHVSVVNGTGLEMGQRPGEDFMRRNGDVGKEGDYAEVMRLEGRKVAEGWGGSRSTPDPGKLDLGKYPRAFLDYLEVEGPIYDAWPPRFQKEFLGETGPPAGEELARAREALEKFLPRAWRRPVGPQEADPFLAIVESELRNGAAFNEAMRVAFSAAITSPKFLLLHEPSPSEELRELDGFELATRLSYFLWSSMPDAELFETAARGELSKPEALMRQVDRMMDDPKFARFVENFGSQWLRTDTFLAFEPNENLFKAYDDRLERAIVEEPLEFFRALITGNESLLNFLDSEFVVVNERLAEHYDIPGVEGDDFRKVSLPADSVRGGLLGMAGIHLAGADGQRTKPVSRAVYVREVLFNDPPDPPPPNAGEIEPNIKGEKLTVRDRLLQHQEIPSCAACHARLDPYGLALENFNVIGRWRDREDGEGFGNNPNTPEIVIEGQLPNGAPFASFLEFRAALRAQEDRFRRGLAEKMFTYALGRPVTPGDVASLDHAVSEMAASNDTMESLLKAVVASQAFRTK